jgi:hypothetical protein
MRLSFASAHSTRVACALEVRVGSQVRGSVLALDHQSMIRRSGGGFPVCTIDRAPVNAMQRLMKIKGARD